MTRPHQPASGRRAGRQQQQSKAKALNAVAAAATVQHQAAHADQADDLRRLVQQHLDRQQHALTTAQLIDLIIDRFPGCPNFASLLVDRLMAGDEALAAALQEGQI